MTNVKSTRHALLMSAVALLLCFAMLMGTTFAWFTDSAASGSNVITAGNLDIVVEYTLDGTNWNNLDGATDLFQKGLWEPGHTEVVALRIKNNGTLALKYAANMNIVNETIGKTKDGANIVLSDILSVDSIIMDTGAMGDALLGVAFDDESTLQYTNTASFKNSNVLGTDETLLPGASKYLIVKVDMAETVGNEANHDGTNIPKIEFGINVLAAQLAYETDSFGNQYDKDAKYPVKVKNADELKNAFENGDNVVLADDIVLNSTLMTKNDAVIDLNGNTITAPSNGYMFHSGSDTDPSITITSSTAGAEINVSGGVTSVLLGYGSTVIENVTINVTGCNNTSPNPFNVYGDLTLGEGTVVNIDYLGTALISNNGQVAINIDGAKINVGTFKTNGTAIITLNNASTLEIKDTEIKISNFVLSSFGGDSLVSKVDGVTIDGCTFDVTDSNGASCTFVAKDGKYRLVQK